MSNGPLYVCLKKVQEQGGGVATPSPTRHPSRTHVREFSPAIPLHRGKPFQKTTNAVIPIPACFRGASRGAGMAAAFSEWEGGSPISY